MYIIYKGAERTPDMEPGAEFVVGLRCKVLEPENVYRIEATLQVKVNGVYTYVEKVEHAVSWFDAAVWLTALLSSTGATTTVADHLSSLRSE
jgi:hypothetical protein